MSVDSTDELDKVLYKIGTGINAVYTSEATTPWCTIHYFKLDKGVCVGCEAKAALQSLIEDRVKKANSTGHWYVKSVQLDAYHNMAHYCVCGYRTSQRGAIDGHVEWQKAQLSNSKDTV